LGIWNWGFGLQNRFENWDLEFGIGLQKRFENWDLEFGIWSWIAGEV
jgi:hypothetical protein